MDHDRRAAVQGRQPFGGEPDTALGDIVRQLAGRTTHQRRRSRLADRKRDAAWPHVVHPDEGEQHPRWVHDGKGRRRLGGDGACLRLVEGVGGAGLGQCRGAGDERRGLSGAGEQRGGDQQGHAHGRSLFKRAGVKRGGPGEAAPHGPGPHRRQAAE